MKESPLIPVEQQVAHLAERGVRFDMMGHEVASIAAHALTAASSFWAPGSERFTTTRTSSASASLLAPKPSSSRDRNSSTAQAIVTP